MKAQKGENRKNIPIVEKIYDKQKKRNRKKGLITFFVPIFIANNQFGTVVFKKFNLVPKFFKIYSK